MPLTESEIRAIVDQISGELGRRSGKATFHPVAPLRPARAQPESRAARASGRAAPGIFETVDEAVAAARRAQREIRTLELREKILANQRKRLRENARELAEQAVAE